MPDLNKQTLINLLIDSPLREPIKINLIDIVNNTKDEDLTKTYSTIAKEIEIYQKATNRRLKLAEEIAAKLTEEGVGLDESPVSAPTPAPESQPKTEDEIEAKPMTSPNNNPLPNPPGSAANSPAPEPVTLPTDEPITPLPTPTPDPTLDPEDTDDTASTPTSEPTLSPVPTPETAASEQLPTTPINPNPEPPTSPQPPTQADDEQALAEIQNELNSLKNSATEDAASMDAEAAPAPDAPPPPPSI